MPELPEVRTVCKHLNKRIEGLVITNVIVNLDKVIKDISVTDFKNKLLNKKIIKVDNIGKWIIIHAEDDNNILVHLRLEGKFRTGHVDGINPAHDHVIFEFDNGMKLFFNDTRQFGTFHLKGENYINETPLSKLGVELKDVGLRDLHKKFSRKRIPIKSTMLDQSIVIGLGNIYINEALWYAKINPNKPTREVSYEKLKLLIDVAYNIMEKSFKLGGSSIATYSSLDGIKGSYQNELKVHGFNGKPCDRCGTTIRKDKVGGRGTYYCPSCQR